MRRGEDSGRCGDESAGKRGGAGGYRVHNPKTAGASLAERARLADLIKFVEGFAKPGEGKSNSLGRKFKARGSEIQVSFFRESSLFKGLRANPNCELASRFSLRLAPRRPALGRVDVPKIGRRNASAQGLTRACFARAVLQSMTASLPAWRPFWEPRAAIAQILKIGNTNRMGQCACRR